MMNSGQLSLRAVEEGRIFNGGSSVCALGHEERAQATYAREYAQWNRNETTHHCIASNLLIKSRNT